MFELSHVPKIWYPPKLNTLHTWSHISKRWTFKKDFSTKIDFYVILGCRMCLCDNTLSRFWLLWSSLWSSFCLCNCNLFPSRSFLRCSCIWSSVICSRRNLCLSLFYFFISSLSISMSCCIWLKAWHLTHCLVGFIHLQHYCCLVPH